MYPATDASKYAVKYSKTTSFDAGRFWSKFKPQWTRWPSADGDSEHIVVAPFIKYSNSDRIGCFAIIAWLCVVI